MKGNGLDRDAPEAGDLSEGAALASAADEDGGLVDAGGAPLTDLEAERQIVGALLTEPALFERVAPEVVAGDFFDPVNRRLFAAIAEAYEAGYTIGIGQVSGLAEPGYVARVIAQADLSADLAELAHTVQACAERRAVQAEAEGEYVEPPESRFGAVRWCDLDAPGPEHDWLIKGILTRGERSLCAGPSMSGKSFAITDMSLAVARGVPFLGRKVQRGLVVYQAGEGGRGLKKRLRAYRQHHEIARDEDLPFVLLTSPVDLYANDADTTALIKEIDAWAAVYKRSHNLDLELVVIDTLSAATPGANENASEDMSKVLARCARIAAQLRCHVMLVHHLNAAGSKPRGHSSLFANIENAIEIIPTDKTVSGGFRADGSEIRRKVRAARISKQKDAEADVSWEFVLKQVVIGKDIDGDPITSCVVVGATDDGGEVSVTHAAKSEQAAKGGDGFKLTTQEALFFQCVLDAIVDHGIAPPAELKLPSSITRVVDYEHVRTLMGRKVVRDDDNTEEGQKRYRERLKAAVRRARETLTRFHIIGVHNPYVWHTGRPVKGFPQTYPKHPEPLFQRPEQKPIGPPGDDITELY